MNFLFYDLSKNSDLLNRKAALIQTINDIQDQETILQIENFVGKDKILNLSKKVLLEKIGSLKQSAISNFGQMLIDHPSDIDQKTQFLETILNEDGFWDGNSLLTQKHGNIYNLLNNQIAKDLCKKISKDLSGNLGIGPTIGIGEVFLALSGKNIKMSPMGDLLVIDKQVELKTSSYDRNNNLVGGRLYSTTGYGSNTKIKQILIEKLIELGVSSNTIQFFLYDDFKPMGGFNFNRSGLTNLNNALRELKSKKKTVEFFITVIKNLYLYIDELYVKKILDSIVSKTGSFDPDQMIKILISIAHDYYKSQKCHDYVMHFNVENGNYVLVDKGIEYFDLIDRDVIKLTSHIDWNDDRGKGSSQIIKK